MLSSILSVLRELLQDVLKRIKPPKPFSWQMLVLLSLFSFIIALSIDNGLVREVLVTFGWGFLILAIGWATANLNLSILGFRFSPGSWLTGAMSLSLLRDWGLVELRSQLLLWPIVAAIIASIPRFLAPGPNLRIPKPSDRQYIVIVVLSHIVISCWVGFGLLIQGWIDQYPATLVDRFDRSAFVVRMSLDRIITDRLGQQPAETMLNQAQQTLEETLRNQTWDETVQWLRNDNGELAILREAVLKASEAETGELWDFGTTRPRTIQGLDDGYSITFRAFWLGPSSHPEGYYMDKTCSLLNREDYQRLQQVPLSDETDDASPDNPNELDTLEAIRDTVLDQLRRLPDRLLPQGDDSDAPQVTILCQEATDVKYPQDAEEDAEESSSAAYMNHPRIS